MKLIKRIVGLFAALLLVGILPGAASGTASFEVETATAWAGKSVSVDISVKNSPGITSSRLCVAFDEALTLESVTYGTNISGTFSQPQKTTGPIILNWVNGVQDYSGNFLFATLTFTVAEDAQSGTYPITVTYDPDDVCNVDEVNVDFSVVNGGVTVSEEAYAVSNLCFDYNWEGPSLCWTVPNAGPDLYYMVFGSTDGGNTWSYLGSSHGSYVPLKDLRPESGVYNAVEVVTLSLATGEVLGECVADLGLNIKLAALPAAQVVLVPDEDGSGNYDLSIAGLTPSVECEVSFMYYYYNEYLGKYSYFERGLNGRSDFEGNFDFGIEAETMAEILADETSSYSLTEYSTTLAEDKLSAAVYISIRNRGFVSGIIAGSECAHADKTEISAMAASCETPGNNLYYFCAACGKALKNDGVTETTSEAEVVAALGHNFVYIDEDGLNTGSCSRCGVTDVHIGTPSWCMEDGELKGAEYTTGFVIIALYGENGRLIAVKFCDKTEWTTVDGVTIYRFTAPEFSAKQLEKAQKILCFNFTERYAPIRAVLPVETT